MELAAILLLLAVVLGLIAAASLLTRPAVPPLRHAFADCGLRARSQRGRRSSPRRGDNRVIYRIVFEGGRRSCLQRPSRF